MIFKFLIFFCFIFSASCIFYNDTLYIEEIKKNVQLLSYYEPWFNQSVNFLNSLSGSDEINLQCKNSLKQWIDGIKANEIWALKFLESTGKTLNGKLVGRNINFGSYDYCVNFQKNSHQNIDFDGQYCMVSLQTSEVKHLKKLADFTKAYGRMSERSRHLVEFNMGNLHGVCIPSTCQIEELVSFTNKFMQSYGFSVLAPNKCSTISEPENVTNLQILSFAILSIFMALCLLSLFIKNDFLSCFSPVDNFKIIYNTTNSNEYSKEKTYLHGIKAFWIFLSIATHSAFLMFLFLAPTFSNLKEFEESFPNIVKMFLKRFILYGRYDIIKNRKIKFNYSTYLTTRYIRIAIIAVPILILSFILPQLGMGPFYSNITNHMYENCKVNGYKILLLSTNLGDACFDICNLGTWFMSSDFHSYMLNYFLIYYLITKPKIGFLIAFAQMFIITLFGIFHNLSKNLDPLMNTLNLQIYNFPLLEEYYFPFFQHYNISILGIFCAYLVKSNIKPKVLDYQIVRFIIGSLTLSGTYLAIWYPHHLEEKGKELNLFTKAFYPFISRILITLPVFWIFYVVCLDYSKILKSFFSLKIWIPFSRLSFGMSLSQFIFIIYSFSITIRSNFNYNALSFFNEIFLNITFTFLLSNFIFFVFEGPLIALLKKYSILKRRSEALKTKCQ